MVGAEGFEPPTSCSQSRRATRLRYAPTRRLSIVLGISAASYNSSRRAAAVRALDCGRMPPGRPVQRVRAPRPSFRARSPTVRT